MALRNPADLSDPIGPRAVEVMMRDLTALGGITVLSILTVSVMLFLALKGNRRSAGIVAVAIAGGQGLSHLSKMLFSRPRPDLVPHGVEVATASFPSGHSMMSAVTYLTLAVMLARVEPRSDAAVCIWGCTGPPTCLPVGPLVRAGRWPGLCWQAGWRPKVKSNRTGKPPENAAPDQAAICASASSRWMEEYAQSSGVMARSRSTGANQQRRTASA